MWNKKNRVIHCCTPILVEYINFVYNSKTQIKSNVLNFYSIYVVFPATHKLKLKQTNVNRLCFVYYLNSRTNSLKRYDGIS